jgi:hypothetical protein
MATGYIMLDVPRPDPQQGTYPRRGGHRPSGTCIVHTSEGNWRSGVAALTRLIQIRGDYGAYHRGCDWADIQRYFPWSWECWQDSETNNWASGISFACKTSDWGNMPADVEEGFYRNGAQMAADFVRDMKSEYGITVPLKRITGAQARAKVPGFCAHGDSGLNRSDPGANFNWTRFFQYTEENLNGKKGFLMALTDKQQDDLYWILCTEQGRNVLADAVLKRETEWFGFDGKTQPAGGRQTVRAADILGWFDASVTGLARKIESVESAVNSRPVANVELDEADLDSLAAQLKEALSPGLAADLARRLAD